MVEGKGEGETLAGRWDLGVVKAERGVMADKGVPSMAETGVSRADIHERLCGEAELRTADLMEISSFTTDTSITSALAFVACPIEGNQQESTNRSETFSD